MVAQAQPAEAEEQNPPEPPAPPQHSGVDKTEKTKRPNNVFEAAGFFRRTVAGIADYFVITLVALLLYWLIASLFDISFPANRKAGVALWFDIDYWLDIFLASDPALITWLTIFGAVMTIYLGAFHILWSRTPGMQLFKMRVINAYGDPINVAVALRRTLGYWLSVLSCGLGFFWIGFDIEHRGLHDWVGGTYVVKNNGPDR